MHIIFSIFDKFGKFRKSGGAIANPANPENQEKQINLTRNFQKISKKFMSKYKNRLKLSHF
ncbi:hypothetical protein CCS77_0886 [Campylobacter concisus]|uniref:Uncharacterized protein n=1 Tax=Campylobacter concisus TaxID=199 RepID=A0A2R4NZT8_9BACT|nr:hypothetical protein CCS77_0886 [Campylobacter concisus]